MKEAFRNIVENRKLERRVDTIDCQLSCIKDDIERVMEEEIDLMPDRYPESLVNILAECHKALSALKP
jgi:hypothetical protein